MNIKIFKWIGTIAYIVCQILTALNIWYPINIAFGLVGGCLWAWVGIKSKDPPLILVDVMPVIIFSMGLAYYFWYK